jgi:hypothetical protein
MSIDVRQTMTGRLLKRANVSKGEQLTFSGHDALVFVGRVESR